MKVRFTVDFKDELIEVENLKSCKVIDTYEDPECFGCGYDTYEVEVDSVSYIKHKDGRSHQVYVADNIYEDADADGCCWISCWKPTDIDC